MKWRRREKSGVTKSFQRACWHGKEGQQTPIGAGAVWKLTGGNRGVEPGMGSGKKNGQLKKVRGEKERKRTDRGDEVEARAKGEEISAGRR